MLGILHAPQIMSTLFFAGREQTCRWRGELRVIFLFSVEIHIVHFTFVIVLAYVYNYFRCSQLDNSLGKTCLRVHNSRSDEERNKKRPHMDSTRILRSAKHMAGKVLLRRSKRLVPKVLPWFFPLVIQLHKMKSLHDLHNVFMMTSKVQ